MKKISLLIGILLITVIVDAQNTIAPCSLAEAKQFDFWIGDWNLYSADTLTGNNSVTKILDGCAVQENFTSPQSNFYGKSWSVYNSQLKEWQQTWVDNQGSFIYLTGKFDDGKMILVTQPHKMPNGEESFYRMTYYNITTDSFDWSWESTKDNGISWKTGWKIHYIRKR